MMCEKYKNRGCWKEMGGLFCFDATFSKILERESSREFGVCAGASPRRMNGRS